MKNHVDQYFGLYPHALLTHTKAMFESKVHRRIPSKWREERCTSFILGWKNSCLLVVIHKYRRFNTPYLTSWTFWEFKSFWAHQSKTNLGQAFTGKKGQRPWGFHWSRVVLSNISCHKLQKEDAEDTIALTPMMTLLWSIVKQAGEKGFRGVFLHHSFQAQSSL